MMSNTLPHQDRRNTKNGKHRYSLVRALNDVADPLRPEGYNRADGLEGEVHEELANRFEHRRPRGFYVPSDVDDIDVRALTTSTGAAAIGDVVPLPMVEVLRARTVLGALGARSGRLPMNRKGHGWVPRRSTAAALTWVEEVAPPDDTVPQTDHVEFIGKDVGAVVNVTRTMLKSAYTPEYERQVVDGLATAIAVEIDRVGIVGPGTDTVPLGLLNTPGIQTVDLGANGAVPTRDKIIEMERLVGVSNGDASADASLGWFGSPNARARLRKLDGSSAGSGAWVWSDAGTILGHPALATTNAPSDGVKGTGTNLSTLVFGDFRSLLIGLMSPLDVFVNPFTQSTNGCVRISVFQSVDIHVLHPESFAVVSDMVTS